jgi:excinuclease UvrABC nuclease subunit
MVSDADYARDAALAEMFLNGKDNEVISEISARMKAASEALRFEQAAVFRDQIQALSAVRARQFVESRSNQDADIIAGVIRGGVACVYLSMVRGGRSLGGRAFFPTHVEDADLPALLEAFAGQHYIGRPIPPRWCWNAKSKAWPTGCPNRPAGASASSPTRRKNAASGWKWRARTPNWRWPRAKACAKTRATGWPR